MVIWWIIHNGCEDCSRINATLAPEFWGRIVGSLYREQGTVYLRWKMETTFCLVNVDKETQQSARTWAYCDVQLRNNLSTREIERTIDAFRWHRSPRAVILQILLANFSLRPQPWIVGCSNGFLSRFVMYGPFLTSNPVTMVGWWRLYDCIDCNHSSHTI